MDKYSKYIEITDEPEKENKYTTQEMNFKSISLRDEGGYNLQR